MKNFKYNKSVMVRIGNFGRNSRNARTSTLPYGVTGSAVFDSSACGDAAASMYADAIA